MPKAAQSWARISRQILTINRKIPNEEEELATVAFESAIYTVSEDGSTTAEVTVVRSGSVDEVINVRVVSEDGVDKPSESGANGVVAPEITKRWTKC